MSLFFPVLIVFAAALIAVAAGLSFGSLAVTLKALLIVIFFYLTTPIAAQMLARAGCLSGARPTADTSMDEIEPHLERLKAEIGKRQD